MTRSEALRILAVLRAAFPDAAVEQPTAELYVRLLADLDAEAVRRAAERHIATERWFPRVAQLRAAVAEERTADLPAPELAWEHVLREVRRVGAYGEPRFRHPELAAAVRSVGWESICRSTMPAAERARFVDAYRAARAQTVRAAELGALALGPRVAAPSLKGKA